MNANYLCLSHICTKLELQSSHDAVEWDTQTYVNTPATQENNKINNTV